LPAGSATAPRRKSHTDCRDKLSVFSSSTSLPAIPENRLLFWFQHSIKADLSQATSGFIASKAAAIFSLRCKKGTLPLRNGNIFNIMKKYT
jgi:hypothetical protein